MFLLDRVSGDIAGRYRFTLQCRIVVCELDRVFVDDDDPVILAVHQSTDIIGGIVGDNGAVGQIVRDREGDRIIDQVHTGNIRHDGRTDLNLVVGLSDDSISFTVRG